jgi:hypothetical protein
MDDSSIDSLIADVNQPAQTASIAAPDHSEVDDLINEINSEKYGSLGQQAITAVEGAGQGIAGPLAPLIEKKILGVKEEDILGRQKENPISHGVGEAAGLVGSTLAGTGMGSVMSKAGELGAAAVGLGEASLGARVGTEAVKQAIEMGVYQSGSEASKMLLNDPETSAESAIANVGMAAALGGVGGAFMTGAVSPLWNATAGPKVESLLKTIADHVNGTAGIVPGAIEESASNLGVELNPILRGGLTNDSMKGTLSTLRRAENKEVLDAISQLQKDTSDAVMAKMGVNPSDIESYSENEAGNKLLESFKREYNEKYEPIAKQLEERNAKAATIDVPDEERLRMYGDLLDQGMKKVQTDSPYYKLYDEYGQRILAKDTIGGLDALKTEIGNRLKGARNIGDYNVVNALVDVKNSITDFQESIIAQKAAAEDLARKAKEHVAGLPRVELPGEFESAKPGAAELINQRADANRNYAEFAKMSDDLSSHLSIGEFRGAGGLQSKLTEKLTPEEVLRKFTIRNNADFINFLQKNFPDTLKEVQANELKKILKPAVLSAKGDTVLNVKKLDDAIAKLMAGNREYVNSVLPDGAQKAIASARMLQDAIPTPRDSGTPAGLTKILKHMPATATGAVSWLLGHNPIAGALIGEGAMHLGKSMPEAMQLGYLKFLGSDQPIKSEAFKSMVEYFHNTVKGNTMFAKATSAIFDKGSKVLLSKVPSAKDTDKLDKAVSKLQDAPNEVYKLQNGHLGHYLPEHQSGLTEVSTRALSYLQSIKPQGYKPSPLDKEIEPSKAERARYDRALEIAQQPAIILQHIKDGTIQSTDIKDFGAMYPGLYKKLATDLSHKMTEAVANEEPIPYKTRMGLSLFLGQGLDTTMQPTSIQAAQAVFAPKPGPSAPGGTSKNTAKMGKNIQDYQTPLQSAEAHKQNKH